MDHGLWNMDHASFFSKATSIEIGVYGRNFAFQNWLGYSCSYVSSLLKGFTETRLEDVDLSKTQLCKYFVYMDQGIQS